MNFSHDLKLVNKSRRHPGSEKKLPKASSLSSKHKACNLHVIGTVL